VRLGAGALATLVMVVAVSWVWESRSTRGAAARGKDLNRSAWELTYLERGVPIPPSGPREGYWGVRLGPKVPHAALGWHEPSVQIPDLVRVDRLGRQYCPSAVGSSRQVLIIGGSVAFGTYASTNAKTYFHVAHTALEQEAVHADLTVFASGAWKSAQEARALSLYLESGRPDLVVFLNGLNDLTNGATAETLFGEKTETADGSKWTAMYHAHDYEQRVASYLENMKQSRDLCESRGIDMLVVLQPSLVERSSPTRVESILLRGSLLPHASALALSEAYASMRTGLEGLAGSGGCHFLDCSRAFASEPETTFTDMWHFTDFGHRILGQSVAGEIAAILRQRTDLD
jgi:hypothetical protein